MTVPNQLIESHEQEKCGGIFHFVRAYAKTVGSLNVSSMDRLRHLKSDWQIFERSRTFKSPNINGIRSEGFRLTFSVPGIVFE